MHLPKIFYVNWFRKAHDGRWLWPGYGENSRVIDWIFRRCDNAADAEETPIGLVPATGAIDTTGLDVQAEDMAELLRVDLDEWRTELPAIHQHFGASVIVFRRHFVTSSQTWRTDSTASDHVLIAAPRDPQTREYTGVLRATERELSTASTALRPFADRAIARRSARSSRGPTCG